MTEPKLVANCLVRLGSADLTCGCRPTAIANRRHAPGRAAHVHGQPLTLDQALAELVSLIEASPTAGTAPGHRQPASTEDGTC
jgi:hypothetical protein